MEEDDRSAEHDPLETPSESTWPLGHPIPDRFRTGSKEKQSSRKRAGKSEAGPDRAEDQQAEQTTEAKPPAVGGTATMAQESYRRKEKEPNEVDPQTAQVNQWINQPMPPPQKAPSEDKPSEDEPGPAYAESRGKYDDLSEVRPEDSASATDGFSSHSEGQANPTNRGPNLQQPFDPLPGVRYSARRFDGNPAGQTAWINRPPDPEQRFPQEYYDARIDPSQYGRMPRLRTLGRDPQHRHDPPEQSRRPAEQEEADYRPSDHQRSSRRQSYREEPRTPERAHRSSRDQPTSPRSPEAGRSSGRNRHSGAPSDSEHTPRRKGKERESDRRGSRRERDRSPEPKSPTSPIKKFLNFFRD